MSTIAGGDDTMFAVLGRLSSGLDRAGLFYRIFGRVKANHSIDKKLSSPEKRYGVDGKLLQDALGVRVVVYFSDDCQHVPRVVGRLFEPGGEEVDPRDTSTFKPMRSNYIFRIPINDWQVDAGGRAIDNTFELQVRTVLSEGWLEVEHDLRYKHAVDWHASPTLERALNGVAATLETAEWAVAKILDSLSFHHYRERDWGAVLRHKFRLRLPADPPLHPKILSALEDKLVARKFWKTDRNRIISRIVETDTRIPITYSNLVYAAAAVSDIRELIDVTPFPVKEKLSRLR